MRKVFHSDNSNKMCQNMKQIIKNNVQTSEDQEDSDNHLKFRLNLVTRGMKIYCM